MNRPKLYELLDDLWESTQGQTYETWKSALEQRGMKIESVSITDYLYQYETERNIRRAVETTVDELCRIMDKNPGHVVVPNPGPSKKAQNEEDEEVCVILIPHDLAEIIDSISM